MTPAPHHVAELCSELIRIDTSNPGRPERPAAEYVATYLADLGLDSTLLEPSQGRTSLMSRVPGRDSSCNPLLVHMHLDVVPAVPAEWSVDPFSGEIRDGYVWGRGAVDMKGMIAAVLASLRATVGAGRVPRRDIILAFFADEEAGGTMGAAHVVGRRPDLFAGCTEAVGEVGGFSYRLSDSERAYLVSTGEKGVYWAALRVAGKAGHGSLVNRNNAIVSLCESVRSAASIVFPTELPAATRALLDRMRTTPGWENATVAELLRRLGPLSQMIESGMRDTVNPTTLEAGYKPNVVPGSASATLDGRYLPGHEERFVEELRRAIRDDVDIEILHHGPALEYSWDTPLFDQMRVSLRRHDAQAELVPYLSTAFTDAKWLSELGISSYGFCPLLLPDDLDFPSLFHGIDERVPVSSLEFAVDVLGDLLMNY